MILDLADSKIRARVAWLGEDRIRLTVEMPREEFHQRRLRGVLGELLEIAPAPDRAEIPAAGEGGPR